MFSAAVFSQADMILPDSAGNKLNSPGFYAIRINLSDGRIIHKKIINLSDQ
jgi:hypothetical protein